MHRHLTAEADECPLFLNYHANTGWRLHFCEMRRRPLVGLIGPSNALNDVSNRRRQNGRPLPMALDPTTTRKGGGIGRFSSDHRTMPTLEPKECPGTPGARNQIQARGVIRTMHFEMISKKVAGQEDAQVAGCGGPAQVSQCYRCHQTTWWDDIRGVGHYKHH